ncbi:MAG: formylglycine-generating enzyme family protein [Opitutaceae bacterium]|jgi:formylglycine-generating enzyme required for sulfatase activity|nr:formylglycine-generating enzyme family protein [Opitutaceae bacterium]
MTTNNRQPTSKMKPYKNTGTAALLLAALMITAGAGTALGQTIPIETVKISGVNNADGPAYGHSNVNQVGYGAVSYDYYIGTKEVTNAQYAQFLNAVASQSDTYALYNTNMAITRMGSEESYTYTTTDPDKPVVYVTFWNAARFCNWLTSGETETGVYDFAAVGSPVNPTNNTINRDADAWAAGGWALPTEDEWYKAAYYDVKEDKYWLFPTGKDTIDSSDANYYRWGYSSALKNVGSYAANQNGIFDIAGNAEEWIDAIYYTGNRTYRGGSIGGASNFLESTAGGGAHPDERPTEIRFHRGFRVVVFSLTSVPEPGTYAAATGLAMLVIGMWLRRGHRAGHG